MQRETKLIVPLWLRNNRALAAKKLERISYYGNSSIKSKYVHGIGSFYGYQKFKQFIKLMGWKAEATPARTRLYDPESGKYLNDKTMQAIEDANAGRNIAFRGTVDEFKAWADAL